jgi:predicted ATPase/DNA-binding winged helix-turn-helix (wHTH) protein
MAFASVIALHLAASVILAFGDFELDEARFELRRHGVSVAVQPKALRLLFLLVQNRHRAVSDGELMETLWPAEKVEHASIKRAVMGARIALGDRGQSSIRTVRGHGYQFVRPLRSMPPPALPSEGAIAPASSGGSSPPAFVGREAVLGELGESLGRAFSGHGQSVLVFGEPGLGKTRLLHEVAARASALGGQVWWGRCLEFDGAPAYWPWQQILLAATGGRSEAELRELLGPGAADIAEGFPELRMHEWFGDGHAVSSSQTRFQLFDSIAQFFVRSARLRPVVLLLDDLQRADQPTLRFLQFLSGQLSACSLLLVATARPADARERATQDRLAELTRDSTTRTITLTGLGRDETARYLELRTGVAAPERVVERLHEQTAGNPLFLEEILRSLRLNEHRLDGAAVDVPWERLAQLGHDLGLRGAIERHLAILPASGRALLTRAAVVGREFSLGVISHLVELPPEQVIALVQLATAAGLLQRSSGPVGPYRFNHALIRDVLYAEMDALERAQWHARVGAWLEARGASDDAELAQVAEHFRLAAPAHDGGKALDYAKRLAERAKRRLAYEEAAVQLTRALELLEVSAPHPVQRVQLLLALGEALLLGDEPVRGRATLLQAVEVARGLGLSEAMVHAARLLSRSRESGTADGARIALLREVLASLPEADPQTPCLMALLAKALSFSNEPAERAQLARSALALAYKLADPSIRAEALEACHEALTTPETLEERVAIATELAQLAHAHADARIKLAALTSHFQNCVERGATAGMERVVSELEVLAQTSRDWGVRWYAKGYRATCAFVAGRFDEAEQATKEALQIGRAVGEDTYHLYCVQMNAVLGMQGRFAEAEAMAREACARYPDIIGWRVWLARIQADAGNLEIARDTLTQVMARDMAMLRRDPYLLSVLCPVAQLCTRVGDAHAARSLYQALLPYADRHGNVSFGGSTYGPIRLQLAQLAVQLRDLTAAEAHSQAALAEAERMRSPTFIALALVTYVFVLLHRADAPARAQGRVLLERALEIVRETGMHGLTGVCQALAAVFAPA